MASLPQTAARPESTFNSGVPYDTVFMNQCHTHVPPGCSMDLPCHIRLSQKAEEVNLSHIHTHTNLGKHQSTKADF